MPTTPTGSPPSTNWIWVQWLSTGLSALCLLVGAGEYSLRYPVLMVGWLLANWVLAVVRLVAQPVQSTELPWLKLFVWVVALASPVLMLWAYSANNDIVFRDATGTVRKHRTMSWFGGGPDEEQIETSHYQTSLFLFEKQVGAIESRPATKDDPPE